MTEVSLTTGGRQPQPRSSVHDSSQHDSSQHDPSDHEGGAVAVREHEGSVRPRHRHDEGLPHVQAVASSFSPPRCVPPPDITSHEGRQGAPSDDPACETAHQTRLGSPVPSSSRSPCAPEVHVPGAGHLCWGVGDGGSGTMGPRCRWD